MKISNKILLSYAIYCRKEIVKILKCYLIKKKVTTVCPRVQFFLANPVVYISVYSLASRTRMDAVVRKYILLWWSFCVLETTIYSQSNFKIKIRSNALKKLRSENLWKL